MQGGGIGSSASTGGGFCFCTVCYDDRVQKALRDVDVLCEKSTSIFSDALDGVDGDVYTSMVGLSDDKILGNVGSTLSRKIAITFLVLTLIILMACIAFVILAQKGIVHIPGLSTGELVGIVLGATFIAYIFPCLGYMMRSRISGDDEDKYGAIRVIDRSKLRKLACDQNKRWDRMRWVLSKIQSNRMDAKRSVIGSAFKDVDVFLKLQKDVDEAKSKYKDLSSDHI
ncbi:putative membrane protein [Candidatus Ichthyocystis hellenicum]|uniref:Putative membrane protein n=1 Tax=Candidatus Ichthyocystis hellenicum TaxID=1561003 RepID=A0A0S4M2Q0_9BURK|nr:hypothetical protein [Candidatus Ichthyocystis hellenicum]CUT17547.1 putative membrane protein [Candidatus Ichthyocystis hellenicum]